jgi:hypothetical protein
MYNAVIKMKNQNKLLTGSKLGERELVVAVAGRLRHVKDAIGCMDLEKLAEKFGGQL